MGNVEIKRHSDGLFHVFKDGVKTDLQIINNSLPYDKQKSYVIFNTKTKQNVSNIKTLALAKKAARLIVLS